MTKLVIDKVILEDDGEAFDNSSAGRVGGYVANSGSGVEVKAYHYPQCCTGAILANLGGSEDAYLRDDEVEGIKAEIQAWVEAIVAGKLGQNKSFISACTTEQQDVANKALEELGFAPSNHIINEVNDYNLITWTLALDGWE